MAAEGPEYEVLVAVLGLAYLALRLLELVLKRMLPRPGRRDGPYSGSRRRDDP